MELSAPILMKRMQTPSQPTSRRFWGAGAWVGKKKAEEQWGASMEEKGTSGSFGPRDGTTVA